MTTFAVVVFPGSNCDRDCVRAIRDVMGQSVRQVWHAEPDLAGSDAVILPGGFSYGDYLRAGAIARFSPVMAAVKEFADRGGLVLGICNGFQILTEAGLLPGALVRNRSLRFICRRTRLKCERADTAFTHSCGRDLILPIAHGQGRYHIDEPGLRRLEKNGQILFRYAADDNPNGSLADIAGIMNERGNVLGMMPHPERAVEDLIGGCADGRAIFASMAAHLMMREKAAA